MFEFRVVEDGEEKVIFQLSKEEILRKITYFGVLTFLGREVNRVRIPKSYLGLIFNWLTAGAVTDAVMKLAFPKKANIIDIQTGDEVSD